MKRMLVLVCCLLAGCGWARGATLTVSVDEPGHEVSPLLWGIFFEDINLSADGGIYPELVRNRSFEDGDEPEHWTPFGNAECTVTQENPMSAKNPSSLRVTVAEGAGGVVNGGYWGMAVAKGHAYHLSLRARGTGRLKAVIEDADGNTVYASENIGPLDAAWKRHRVELTAEATDPKARLKILSNRAGTFQLDMVSLMPAETWKGHGLRPDLCEMLAGLKPAFLRFPGGCWVEGDTMEQAYRWKRTLGDISERTPLWNIWGYWATHGLGYHEYLQLCEDLGAEPMFCINCGMSHNDVVPLDEMDEYVQDALDAIEYANGPVTSTWGARRAAAGHPEPFNLKYLEIGNENGGPAYYERWALFHKAIKARYPEIQLIANVWGDYPADLQPDIVDEHYYSNPEFFIGQAGKYDSYDRDGPTVFVGEYAVTRGTGQGNLRGAIGEAAFMTGMERNSDVVVMAAYAPLFVNVNHRRWNPDLINFDSSRVYGLPSYYVQKLFAEHRGEVVLPVAIEAAPLLPKVEGGAVGVGTWLTRSEFKDVRVTRDDEVLFASDFTESHQGWRLHGGNWQVRDGALQQTGEEENVRAFAGDPEWRDYTLSLKARKLGGEEGFLVSFRVGDEGEKSWWNIGGWGNQQHGIEMEGVETVGVPGRIETGRWYDIRIEVDGPGIRCFLDGELVHDVRLQGQEPLYASATRAGDEVVLKVVNVTEEPVATRIDLRGVEDVGSTAAVSVLTSENATDENSLEEPLNVAPTQHTIDIPGPAFDHAFPPNSFTVVRVPAGR